LPLYFFYPANHFIRLMTRRFLSLIIFSSWLAGSGLPRAEATNAVLVQASVLEGNVAYLRVGEVTGNLPEAVASAQTTLAATNKLAGTVLDLRFADGDDSAAARATANLFADKKLPLAILINSKTGGAALALATDLREARDGLVLGSATADLTSP
jgi:C-terminal processing protease CtpA/Prc